jgi:biopolymer transport protein ExbD
MIRFNCPQCGKKFKAPAEMAGRVISCGQCRTNVTVPAALAEPPPPKDRVQTEDQEVSAFHVPKKPVFEDLVDMTAMVDIVFFLLIFFMVTSLLGLYSAISVPPPSAEKSTAKVKKTAADYDNDQEYVVVRVDRDNGMWMDGDKVMSEQELRVKLRTARQGVKGAPGMKKLMVLGNGDCHTVAIVKVIDAGNDSGMEEVQLALDDES